MASDWHPVQKLTTTEWVMGDRNGYDCAIVRRHDLRQDPKVRAIVFSVETVTHEKIGAFGSLERAAEVAYAYMMAENGWAYTEAGKRGEKRPSAAVMARGYLEKNSV